MSNFIETFLNSNRPTPNRFAVIITVLLLIVPGCKTPQLQHADRGPTLPEHFNWFNGANRISFGSENQATNSRNANANSKDSHTDSKKETALDKDREIDPQNNSFPTEDLNLNSANGTTSPVQQASASMNLDDDSQFAAAKFQEEAKRLNVDGTTSEILSEQPEYEPFSSDLDSNNLESSAQLGWNEFFEDQYLTSLISEALVGNQELKILTQQVRIACLEVQSRRGAYLPFVSLGAGAGLAKPSLFTPRGAVEDQLEAFPGKSFPDPLPEFLVATNVSWEVDIWKKLRRAQGAASLRYFATQEGQNYIVTRLVAEIAEDYYELLALDNRLATLDKTIEIQEASLKIAEAKKLAGRGTELAVQRFQAEVQKNQSAKLIIHQDIIETENRINFTLGRYPQPVERTSVEYIDLTLRQLSAGVPSQQLLNRADIRQAEREMAAAGLDVQVARANFYPSLRLTAGLGLNAFNTRYLLQTPESYIYNIAGELVGPLINKKAIKAEYLTANARQLQAVYDYQRVILIAHIEVVNQMTMVDNYGKSIEIKKQQLKSLEGSVDSATKLFQNARAEYVEVLLAQRDLMEAKMTIIETKQQQLGAVVNAYQALGGGGNGNSNVVLMTSNN